MSGSGTWIGIHCGVMRGHVGTAWGVSLNCRGDGGLNRLAGGIAGVTCDQRAGRG